MFRIDDPTATNSLPLAAAPGTPGYFTEGNPGLGTPATRVTGDFLNMVQEELLAVVVAGGGTPTKGTLTQVRDAIASLISSALGTGGHTRTVLTSGTGLTYTTPAGVKKLFVRAIGAGSSGGTTNAAGNAGTSTIFGTLTCTGGSAPPSGASATGQTSAGSATGGDVNISGGTGGSSNGSVVSLSQQGADGGNGKFGGAGGGGLGNPVIGTCTAGSAAAANSGAGGGGGGSINNVNPSFGGNAGGYVEKLFAAPGATYSYSVGVGGASVSGDSSCAAGGAGGSGIIIIDEYY